MMMVMMMMIKIQNFKLLYSYCVLLTNISSQYDPAIFLTTVKNIPAISSYGFVTSHLCLVFQQFVLLTFQLLCAATK